MKINFNKTTGWHKVHDFLHGFGYREYIEGTCDHTEKCIWCEDIHSLLKLETWEESKSELDEMYEKLNPLIEERNRIWFENYKSPTFDKISIPLVKRTYPKLFS